MALLNMDGIQCGGTVLGPEWLITAGHCCEGGTRTENIRIYVNLHDSESESEETDVRTCTQLNYII